MIIQNANIQFAHAHQLKEEYKQKETLLTQRPDNEDGSTGERATLESREVEVSRSEQQLGIRRFTSGADINTTSADNSDSPDLTAISQRGRALVERIQELAEEIGGTGFVDFLQDGDASDDEISGLDAETYQLKSIVESFTGKEIKLSAIRDEAQGDSAVTAGNNNISTPPEEPPTVTASLIYQYQESYLEEESSLFSATGSLTLESGETIDVDFSQFSQRSFYLENSLELKVGEVELTDPLVVNLQGAGLSLSDEKYRFDLDNDGELDSINFATANSGFLALDRNQNGTIDDGAELFGALTGNGFLELAEFDDDGNGFIDSGDGVFSQLQFYQKDSQGNDRLQNISDLGIGALYLGSQNSPFQVKDSDNQLQAVVRSSGIYVNENGTTGSLQQIDLAV